MHNSTNDADNEVSRQYTDDSSLTRRCHVHELLLHLLELLHVEEGDEGAEDKSAEADHIGAPAHVAREHLEEGHLVTVSHHTHSFVRYHARARVRALSKLPASLGERGRNPGKTTNSCPQYKEKAEEGTSQNTKYFFS